MMALLFIVIPVSVALFLTALIKLEGLNNETWV